MVLLPIALLLAAGLIYFWPIPTIQQVCRGGDQWCSMETPGHHAQASKGTWSEWPEAIHFYVSTPPSDLWWWTSDFLADSKLGPHAIIATAYILSKPAAGEWITYQVFGWNASMAVVNPVPGSGQREAGPYGYFHLVFSKWEENAGESWFEGAFDFGPW
ncbi:MAG: hypothetical protein WED08_01445 [Patescibacteria group bacterium]